MYGAAIGDIVGSPYEFDHGKKSKDFDMFSKASEFTDDTVMTVAVAEALLKAGKDAGEAEIRTHVTQSMREWGRRYPYSGYGGNFSQWLRAEEPEPYYSYGNGSAMRVSAAGWLYDTVERTREVARVTAEVTHNHPEGIKGAEATAAAIFLARTGKTKEEIKEYIEKEFRYDLEDTCDNIRPWYRHTEKCYETVPPAIIAFLEGTDFEDVVRNAVSLGGDCDTLTAIAASIGEAFYEIPQCIIDEAKKRMPEEFATILGQI